MTTRPTTTSTVDIDVDLPRDRRGRAYRRVFITALAVVVALALSGRLGVRSATVDAQGEDGYRLSVRYPRITRAGLPASLRIDVQRDAGLDESVTIAMDANYLERFDQQGVRPDPEASFSRGDLLIMEFEAPDRGREISIRVDVIVETGAHFGKSNRIAILDDDGDELVGVSFETRIAP